MYDPALHRGGLGASGSGAGGDPMRRSWMWSVMALILVGDARADEPPSPARKAVLESAVARRSAERARKAAAVARRRAERARAEASARAHRERMAPILAARQIEMARVQAALEAQWLEAR